MIGIAVGEIEREKMRFFGENAKRMVPFRKLFDKAILEGEAVNIDATISGRAVICQADNHNFEIIWIENPTVEFETESSRRSMNQHKTLRGIERFIAWAMLLRKPLDTEVEFVHEAVLEDVGITIVNPISGHPILKRTSMMSAKEMAQCIERALVMLALQDISNEVMAAIGGDMKKLWDAWYTWRYENDDPLFDLEQAMTWDEYRVAHPVCEICGVGPTDNDPLERQHIVSGGSAIDLYEIPWNWIHGHHSHHAYQHQYGWNRLVADHPHIRGKVDRARELGRKQGLC